MEAAVLVQSGLTHCYYRNDGTPMSVFVRIKFPILFHAVHYSMNFGYLLLRSGRLHHQSLLRIRTLL